MSRIRRALAPVLLAAVVLVCACALQRALACPLMPQPQTLRVLYKHSARVVVAGIGTTEVLATERGQQLVRTALHVKEDLKGSGERLVHFYHWEPVRDESNGQNFVFLTPSMQIRPEYKEGQHFLFFLERREGGDGFEVNDEGYGVKALPDDEMKVYRERIRELAAITRPETEDKAALVEWLVRCAEEPATRWEGAYELQQSALAANWEKQRAAGDAARVAEEETPAAAAEESEDEETAESEDEEAAEENEEEADDEESAEDSDEEEAEESDEEEAEDEDDASAATPNASASPGPTPLWRGPRVRFTSPDPSFAPLLDARQKRRLADALYGAREMGEGENSLLDLVKDYGETAFPVFVMAQLRRVEEDPPYDAGSWLHALATSLDSKELVTLAEAYARGQDFTMRDELAANGRKPKEAESEEERAERLRVSVERATQKRSAALKSALSQVELFLVTGTLASK